jgi:hypothetical protein
VVEGSSGERHQYSNSTAVKLGTETVMGLRVITDRAGLLDLIHDHWFRLSEARRDARERTFTVLLSPRRRGPYNRRLVITDVIDARITDPERIDLYTFNDITTTQEGLEVTGEPNLVMRISLGTASEIKLLTTGEQLP